MQLKPITKEGVPAALQKAERYRLLNDSSAAESICLDILQVEPENQSALVTLLLSISDQFAEELSDGVHRAREVLPRLTDDYKRAYYAGIICERRGEGVLHRAAVGAGGAGGGGVRGGGGPVDRAGGARGAGTGGGAPRRETRGFPPRRAQPGGPPATTRRSCDGTRAFASSAVTSRAADPRHASTSPRSRNSATTPTVVPLRLPRRADSCSARSASPGRRSSAGRRGNLASRA